jgi:hypothetical protein
MSYEPDDLGDAKSRAEARNYGETFERRKSDEPLTGAFMHRWIPTGARRASIGDLVSIMLGIAFVLAIFGGHILGYY